MLSIRKKRKIQKSSSSNISIASKGKECETLVASGANALRRLRKKRKLQESFNETPQKSKKIAKVKIAQKLETPDKGKTYHSQPDEVSISPTRTSANNFDMHFVNRQRESIELYRCLTFQNADSKSFMPFLSQLYGSGKTTLVRYFRDVVEKVKNVPLKRNPLLDKAILIEVNLGTLDDVEGNETLLELVNTNILGALCDAIERSEPMKNYVHIVRKLKEERKSLGNFLKNYIDFQDELPPLLISFDEVQVLETGNIVTSSSRLLKFWSILVGSLIDKEQRRLFFVLVGKSQPLVLLGWKERIPELTPLDISPSPSAHIILRALSAKHIEESIRKTMVDQEPLLKVLETRGLKQEDVSFFCERLYFYTGGIPRLVYRVCESILCTSTTKLRGRDVIDRLFQSSNSFYMIQKSPEVYLLRNMDGPLHRILSTIFLLSAFGVTFPDNDTTFKGSSKTFKSMTELLHNLPMYIDKVDDVDRVVYRVLFPECVIQNMDEPATQHLSLLKGFQKHASILNQGELLEYLTSNTIIMRILSLQQMKKNLQWKDVSQFYSESNHLSELVVDINLSEMVFLPKISTNRKKTLNVQQREEVISLPWSRDVSPEDWKWIVQKICKVKCLHKSKPMSKACDLYFYPVDGLMVGFALKNYGLGSNFDVSKLQDEIDKAGAIIDGSIIKKFTLFIMCRTHNTFRRLFESENICRIDSGQFSWTGDSFIHSDSSRKCSIQIPEGMEVVILGETAFEEFFGKAMVEILTSIADTKSLQQSSFSLLSEMAQQYLKPNDRSSSGTMAMLRDADKLQEDTLVRDLVRNEYERMGLEDIEVQEDLQMLRRNRVTTLIHWNALERDYKMSYPGLLASILDRACKQVYGDKNGDETKNV